MFTLITCILYTYLCGICIWICHIYCWFLHRRYGHPCHATTSVF